jgi:hypothetical protein
VLEQYTVKDCKGNGGESYGVQTLVASRRPGKVLWLKEEENKKDLKKKLNSNVP